jgi:hypothetical protein
MRKYYYLEIYHQAYTRGVDQASLSYFHFVLWKVIQYQLDEGFIQPDPDAIVFSQFRYLMQILYESERRENKGGKDIFSYSLEIV